MHAGQLTLSNPNRTHTPLAGLDALDDEALAWRSRGGPRTRGGPFTSGEPQAFSELYNRYLDRVYGFILIRTGDVQDAQDLTSQTFLAALESIDGYDGRGSFGGWLFGIARHKIADHYRRRRRQVPLDDADLLHDPDPSPEEMAHTHLQLERVAQALRGLDAQQAEAVALRIFGQLDAAQVAQVMGKSQDAAKMLVHRGLRHLQQRLVHNQSLEVSL
ncbi:MAG: sigma-70 family RNA polymerase sigma factor [Anaerolineae bacterium]|nr:sigma-70 family RNA polymerase sigma factor [Anaerolineae bacterium]